MYLNIERLIVSCLTTHLFASFKISKKSEGKLCT